MRERGREGEREGGRDGERDTGERRELLYTYDTHTVPVNLAQS